MNVRGFGIPLHHLPNELQGELHLSRSCDRRTRQQSRVVQCSRRRKGLSRARRGGIEVCVIEDVEDLPPKLHVERFRDPMNWVVFEQGKSKSCSPGPLTVLRRSCRGGWHNIPGLPVRLLSRPGTVCTTPSWTPALGGRVKQFKFK